MLSTSCSHILPNMGNQAGLETEDSDEKGRREERKGDEEDGEGRRRWEVGKGGERWERKLEKE